MKYNAPKIIAMVRAIALSHGVELAKLHVSHGAALVMHGMMTGTDDIEIQVDPATWSELSKWHRPLFDSTGCHLVLPNDVTIWPIDSLAVEHKWDTRSEVRFATTDSLLREYRHFIEHRLPHRAHKFEADQGKVAMCEAHIERDRRLRQDAKCAELKSYSNMILGFPTLKKVLAMSENLVEGEEIITEVKGADNIRWEIKLNDRMLSVKELSNASHGGLQRHSIYSLRNLRELIHH